ncbi:MAG TPA: DUF4349 domain-containing protein [Solirubrobacteraceae bacterium]|nr:DUF4349 domain-containing protein [Solirubrobacteraceae bacterium]
MTEMEQLREDVRATAPQPRPEFAAQLERRVEAGFAPEEGARRRRPRRINLLRPAVALGCTALLALVMGAIALDQSDDDAPVDTFSGESAQQEPFGLDTGEDQSDEGGGGGGGEALSSAPDGTPLDDAAGGNASAQSPPGNLSHFAAGAESSRAARVRGRDGSRVVEQRTQLELETGADEFQEVADDVLRVADDSDAIVQRSTVSEQDGRGFARYDLRVPASRLEETLAALSRLAHVTSRSASTQDITRAYVSATDRLDDARAERNALLKALERADTDVEAEAIRRQIRLARDRIAIAERDVAALQRRADRARVTVTVRSTGRKSPEGAWTPGDALDDAGRILEVAAGVVVVTAAALVPVAILGLLGVLAGRAVRRRRREAALDVR